MRQRTCAARAQTATCCTEYRSNTDAADGDDREDRRPEKQVRGPPNDCDDASTLLLFFSFFFAHSDGRQEDQCNQKPRGHECNLLLESALLPKPTYHARRSECGAYTALEVAEKDLWWFT